MNKEACIIKPGHTLNLSSADLSHFGGMSEIYGLATDLISLGYTVCTDKPTVLTKFIFLFPSAHAECPALENSINNTCRRILCLTDLNLYRQDQQKHFDLVLLQVPGSPGYFPFHKYIVRASWNRGFSSYDDWQRRTRTLIYAGGTRLGARDQGLISFFSRLTNYSIFTSSPSLDHLEVDSKISFSSLIEEYANTKFAFFITDPTYEALGWVPQRYYEYLCCGMVPVFDSSCTYLARHESELIAHRNGYSEKFLLSPAHYEDLANYYASEIRAANQEMRTSPSLLANHLSRIK